MVIRGGSRFISGPNLPALGPSREGEEHPGLRSVAQRPEWALMDAVCQEMHARNAPVSGLSVLGICNALSGFPGQLNHVSILSVVFVDE